MKKRIVELMAVSLSVVLFLTACNENDVDEEEAQEFNDAEEGEEAEAIDNTYNEESEADDGNGEAMLEDKSIAIQQELWHTDSGESYEVNGKVGPIIRDGDLAILPVTLNTDSELTVQFPSLFSHGVGTGEGIATQQGLDIRMIDTQEMTVSHPAV